MNDGTLLQRLKAGARKTVGEAPAIGQELAGGGIDPADLFDLLVRHAGDAVVVSHGTHALKDAAHKKPDLAPAILDFFIAEIGRFDGWEARENFLRVAVRFGRDHPKAAEIHALAVDMTGDRSAIVAAYALEVAVTLSGAGAAADALIRDGLEHPRAAVRARARKLAAGTAG